MTLRLKYLNTSFIITSICLSLLWDGGCEVFDTKRYTTNIFENVVFRAPITLALGQLSYYSITLRRVQSSRAACNYIIINNNQRGSRKRILGLSRCRILYYMCKSSSHIKLVVVIGITFFFFCLMRLFAVLV